MLSTGRYLSATRTSTRASRTESALGLTLRAAPVQDHIVAGDRERHALGELVDRLLEGGVLERKNPLAVVADDMVMVLAAGSHRFVAPLAVAGVEALDQRQRVQCLE